MSDPEQSELDRRNAEFWNELCGTAMARSLGITHIDPFSLARFDAAYMQFYPYLWSYLPSELARARVLEVGLGFGTLAQKLLEAGADYHGVDLSPEPVAMVAQRLGWSGAEPSRAVCASALDLPFPSGYFDAYYSIGCLHHTGGLVQAVQECHRVLRPGGRAVVMLYHQHSWRRLSQMLWRGLRGEELAGLYDRDSKGQVAPHTDFVSRHQARRLFRHFDRVELRCRNMDPLRLFGRVVVARKFLLGTLDRWLGLDLYIEARR